MSDFNEFKGKAEAFASKAAQAAKDLASKAATKTKQVSRIARLNMDISKEKETIKRLQSEIGQLYYELHHDAPEEALAQLCQEVSTAYAAIASMQAEISQLKEGAADTEANYSADADFAAVVDETETTGSAPADTQPDDDGIDVEIKVTRDDTPAGDDDGKMYIKVEPLEDAGEDIQVEIEPLEDDAAEDIEVEIVSPEESAAEDTPAETEPPAEETPAAEPASEEAEPPAEEAPAAEPAAEEVPANEEDAPAETFVPVEPVPVVEPPETDAPETDTPAPVAAEPPEETASPVSDASAEPPAQE